MERRFVIFLILSFGILLGSSWLMQWLYPPPPRPLEQQREVAAAKAPDKAKPAAGAKKELPPAAAEKAEHAKPAAKPEKAPPAMQAAPEPEAPEQWVTLGSASDHDPYRMLVTLDSRGAALARIELSSTALSRHRRSQRLSGPPGDGLFDPRRRLSGAGRRPRHPGGRGQIEGGRRHPGPGRETRDGRGIAGSPVNEDETQTDRATFRRPRRKGANPHRQAPPAPVGSDQTRGRRSALHALHLAAI